MDTIKYQERRAARRNTVSLSAIVKGHESAEVYWKEPTIISTVSRTGASFDLQKECSIGRLLSLILLMPVNFRCYDLETEFYRVWGLVQHCTPISNVSFAGYHVGIAFIGKYAPTGYKENPLHSYRISGIGENGLWKIFEAPRAFVSRKNPRFNAALEVNLAVIDAEGNIVREETATTENISLSGAAITSTLDAIVGEQITFTCAEHNFSSIAIVRNQQTMGESVSTLHIEFVGSEFPVRGLFPPVNVAEAKAK